MHSRKAIKAKFISILTDKTAAEDRIEKNRWIPTDDEDLDFPFLGIYAVSETVEDFDTELDRRKLDVIVEAICKGNDADDDLDDLTDDIENALFQNQTLDDTVSSFRLKSTDIGQDETAGSDIVAARLTYEVEYFTSKTANDPTDDFERVEITGGIKDSIELEQ